MGVVAEKAAIDSHVTPEDIQHGEIYNEDEEVVVGW
jgi:hypothetical protein